VGPAFDEIAKKLNNKEIANSIKNGSRGKWKECKNIPMPAFKKINDNDIQEIVKWIKNDK
jgi:cytochrome c551/c552